MEGNSTVGQIQSCNIDTYDNGLFINPGTVKAMYDCNIYTTTTAVSAGPVVITPNSTLNIYSGTYFGEGTTTVTFYGGTSNIDLTIHGGLYKAGTATSGKTSGLNGISPKKYYPAGYGVADEPDENGFYWVGKKSDVLSTLTVNVTPKAATLILKDAAGTTLTAESGVDGTYVFKHILGGSYSYTVEASGYKTKTGIIPVGLLTMSVDIELESMSGGNSNPTAKTAKGGTVITSGGVYAIEDGATGTITIATREPVTLMGKGINPADKFSDLTIDCAAGTDLTIQNLYIWNNFGQGTAAGATNPGDYAINFTGQGNTLRFEGVNLLEGQEYVQSAVIHVAKGTSLTLDGTGTPYLYKYSQGACIGGNSYEACDTIDFAGGTILVKGSKTGAVVGGDAEATGLNAGQINGDIIFSGADVTLITVSQGAAIRSSNQGACAGDVYVTGGSLTVISSYNTGIGSGGGNVGGNGTVYVSGGSFKATRTGNSFYAIGDDAGKAGNGVHDQAWVNYGLVKAAIKSGSGSDVSLLTFDTSKLRKSASVFNVTLDGKRFTSFLHTHKYAGNGSRVTVENFDYDNDQNLYLFLTKGEHNLTVNSETFKIA